MLEEILAGSYNSEAFYDVETTPERRVYKYEMEILLHGEGASFINGIRYPHMQGTLLFAKPGNVRFSAGRFSCAFFKFETVDRTLCAALDALPSGVFCVDAQPLCRKKETTAALMLRSYVYEAANILCALLQCKTEETTHSGGRYLGAVLKAKAYMDENYAVKINLERLAQNTYLSKNFLRVQFEACIGVSPHIYLQSVRLARAKQMLAETQMPLSEVALACGYESQAYMTYCFKKQLGISPLKYRKHYAGGEKYEAD